MDLKLKDNSNLKLASFTQLEYIESTGTQWIDTGIKAAVSDNFYIEYQFTTSGNDERSCFGVHGVGQANMIMRSGWYWGSNRYNYTQGTTKHILSKENTVWTLDGIVLQYTTNAGNIANNNWGLFTAPSGTNHTSYASAVKIYNFKLYRGGALIANFIPARSNRVCFYDTVSETFFYNQGTGDFIAGPVVGKNILPETILLKTTTLYHKNTPNVGGLQLLNSILGAQETDENVVLNRIRVEIGNVSGSLTELLQYSGMTGFNDAGEEQAKPRLVGTWTINDWYTQEQLNQARQVFDGLSIIADPNYLINFDDLAVQVLDSTKPNYNPAVGIAIASAGKGITISDPVVNGGGRWFMTKVQAEVITNMSQLNVFREKTSFTDTQGIVTTDTTLSYDFTSFDEFQYFINITAGGGFSHCWKLESIVLHDNVTSIGYDGFYNCGSLRRINLPQSITYIDNGAFANTGPADLTEDEMIDINLPNLTYIGNSFGNSKLVKSITNLGSVTEMNWSFSRCPNLRTAILPNTLQSIDCFTDCGNLKMPDIPTSVTTIGKEAFKGVGANLTPTDDELKTINLPNLVSLGPSAFNNNKFIKEIVNLGNITTLGDTNIGMIFESCQNLKKVVIPSAVTAISFRMFNNCSNLEEVNIPNGVTYIGYQAFSNCVKLKLTNIPSNITTIGKEAFKGVGGSLTLSDSDLIDLNLPNLQIISNYSFQYCKLIKRVIDLGSITYMADTETTSTSGTFEGASNLVEAILPATLTSYPHRMFSQCNSLTTIHILSQTPPTFMYTPTSGDYWDTFGQHSKIYVGDGSSAANDDTILQAYLADTTWATYSSRLDTWYNYLHPAT